MNKMICTPKNAIISHKPVDLKNIHLEDKNIAIYERDIEALQDEISELILNEIKFQEIAGVEELISRLRKKFKKIHIENSKLINDISKSLYLFQSITNSTSFRLLLKTITTDMCTKFHADVNTLRLLCTYAGPSTLWLQHAVGNQNGTIKIDINNILEVGTGNIVILKGELYPNSTPVYHRSPAVEQNNETRLVLRIDIN